MELMAEINRSGITVLIVTHDPEVAAKTPRTIRIHDGKIVNALISSQHAISEPAVL